MIGISFMLKFTVSIIMTFTFCLVWIKKCRVEEESLLWRFGNEYVVYKKKVKRLLLLRQKQN